MKKYLLMIYVFILVVLASCQQRSGLNDGQRAAIITEVEKFHSDLIANLSKLDIELWTEPWSKNEFIAVSSGVNYFSTLDEFRDSVKYWFSLRERQQVRIVERNIKVLAPDLVLLTSKLNWDIQFKNGEHFNSNGLTTVLYRKELNGWKGICLHESWKGN